MSGKAVPVGGKKGLARAAPSAGSQRFIFATGVDRNTRSSIQKAAVLKCKPHQ